jgi:hypothetical protein
MRWLIRWRNFVCFSVGIGTVVYTFAFPPVSFSLVFVASMLITLPGFFAANEDYKTQAFIDQTERKMREVKRRIEDCQQLVDNRSAITNTPNTSIRRDANGEIEWRAGLSLHPAYDHYRELWVTTDNTDALNKMISHAVERAEDCLVCQYSKKPLPRLRVEVERKDDRTLPDPEWEGWA